MLLTVIVVSLLAAGVLYVTAGSRDLTSRYIFYAGVYDMALAGNEHALFLFNAAAGKADEIPNSGTETNLREAIADLFETELKDNGFTDYGTFFRLKWSAEIYTNITELFEGETTVRRVGDNFKIVTKVTKKLNGQKSYPASVQMDIQWLEAASNTFDAGESPVVKSKRI